MKRQFNSKVNSGYDKYIPGPAVKIILYISVFSGLVAMFAALSAGFIKSMMVELFITTLVAFVVAILGGIIVTIDILRFNRQQRNIEKSNKSSKTTTDAKDGPDMVRMVNFIVGLVLGLVIGYLKWGIK